MLSDHLSSQSVRLWDCTMPITNRMKRILAGWRIRVSSALRLRVDRASRYEADGSFGGLGSNQQVKVLGHKHPTDQKKPGFLAEWAQRLDKSPAEALRHK